MTTCRGPQLVSAAWATWAWATAAAYVGEPPSTLDVIVRITPWAGVWWMWAIPALLLTIGAIGAADGCAGALARWCRIAGLSIICGLLAAWTIAYAADTIIDGTRMWVSAKNYSLILVVALLSAHRTGRDSMRRAAAG